MANITKRGIELAWKLAEFTDTGNHPLEVCSLIARHAVSLHGIYEAQCNGHPAASDPRLSPARVTALQERHEAWCAKREAVLERRITELAATLPGIAGVRFCGDPRGAAVRLVTANGRGDSWDEPKAICV